MTEMLKEPNNQQLVSVAERLKDRLLRNWSVDHIAQGIRRVRVNEVGIVSEVYVSEGLFARLCHQHFGNRTRRAFDVNGYRVKTWRPNPNGIQKST